MNNRIAYPIYMAAEMLMDSGTLEGAEVTVQEVIETQTYFISQASNMTWNEELPTVEDVKRAFEILGAKVMT